MVGDYPLTCQCPALGHGVCGAPLYPDRQPVINHVKPRKYCMACKVAGCPVSVMRTKLGAPTCPGIARTVGKILRPEAPPGMTPANATRKYKNRRVLGADMDGKPHWYDSQREADYALQLKVRTFAGEVRCWRPHPRLKLSLTLPHGVLTLLYIPDFYVVPAVGDPYYVDVKGYMNPKDPTTRLYRVKREAAQKQLGVVVMEVGART